MLSNNICNIICCNLAINWCVLMYDCKQRLTDALGRRILLM